MPPICMLLWIALFLLSVQARNESRPPVAGSAACQSCHSGTYSKWADSIHGRMIQPANRTSVVSVADLAGGPATKKVWRDGIFYIEEDGVENRIDYTLGNRRIQHYLTTRPDGQIHVMHTAWDVKRQQWFDSKEIVPGAPAVFVQQWNTTCFYCHVTQQEQDVKGFDPKTFEYKTSWVESSATCERCHGPMAEHAAAAVEGKASDYPPAKPATPFARLMMCGQCHWPKSVAATGFNTRKEYFDFYSPALMFMEEADVPGPSWWVDGRPRRFSTEAAAFYLSGCFQSGKAMCTSCHDPHWNRTDGNDALMKNADQYCQRCHSGLKTEQHTHHAVESTGSSCVGCHMPHSVQGVKATMRDHSMSVPEPENTVRYDVPNACNECHTDQTAEWALENVERWYPARSSRPRLRATAFSLARKSNPRAVGPLIALAGDSRENAMIRATAAGFLSGFPGDVSRQVLISLTRDKEPMIRIQAARALGAFPGESSAIALAALLDDPYRVVRVQAASSLTSPLFPKTQFSDARQPSFDKAVGEFRRSLEVEGDHPNVQVRLGGLELTLGRFSEARDAYRRALKLDAAEADAYVGLALVDLETGNHSEALRNARRAVEVSNKDVYRKFLDKVSSLQ